MFFHHDHLKLYYQKSGHGPAIILLHGNGEDHTLFADLITYLAPHYTVPWTVVITVKVRLRTGLVMMQ